MKRPFEQVAQAIRIGIGGGGDNLGVSDTRPGELLPVGEIRGIERAG